MKKFVDARTLRRCLTSPEVDLFHSCVTLVDSRVSNRFRQRSMISLRAVHFTRLHNRQMFFGRAMLPGDKSP